MRILTLLTIFCAFADVPQYCFATGNTGATVLLDINFKQDFAKKFDPDSAESLFEWILKGGEKDGYKNSSAPHVVDEKDGLVTYTANPFDHWAPQSFGIDAALLNAFDMGAVSKKVVNVSESEVLQASIVFNCETFKTDAKNFTDKLANDTKDDPRLASCGFFLADNEKTGIALGILLTNEGIWAVYERQERFRALHGDDSFRAYSTYRRVENRTHVNDLVAARIEVDRARNETRFYVNETLVWQFGDGWGAPPTEFVLNAENNLVSITAGSLVRVVPSSFSILIELAHKMDVADPNNIEPIGDAANKALVKYVNATGYYGKNLGFWDDTNSVRENVLYGQGAKIGLQRLLVEKTGPVTNKKAGGDIIKALEARSATEHH